MRQGMGGRSRRRRDRGRDRSRSSGSESSAGSGRQPPPARKRRKAKNGEAEKAPTSADIPGAPARAENAQPGEQESAPSREKGAWRTEVKQADTAEASDDDVPDGLIVQDETEEDVEKKLRESRARREALMAKWVTRGEGQEGGGLHMPDTACSLEDDSGSDGETAQFFAKRRQEQEEVQDREPTALEKAERDAKQAVTRFIMAEKAREEERGDMFGEEGDDEAALKRRDSKLHAQAIGQTGASGADWDEDLYYKAQVGEMMNNRYRVFETLCGKGTFSNVVKCTDEKTKEAVAIKVIRSNDMMRKAAEKEVEILNRLAQADKGNKKHVIRLLATFDYRDHYCLVFECMWDNLRVAQQKYTKGEGMSLKAVRAYTKQLLVALRHIHRCELVHADIKPDNILISAGHNLVKICDLGSAMELTEVEITPYLVSRFYRAPEIVIGAKYGQAADTFALGATLLELFTGKILFPGKSNNDMLRLFMEVKGKLPHKFIKTGTVWKSHFDENLDFKFLDRKGKKVVTRIITDLSAKRPILEMVMARIGPEKQRSTLAEDLVYVKKAKQLADVCNQMTALDPEKRADLETMQSHAFVADAMEKKPKEGDGGARRPPGRPPG